MNKEKIFNSKNLTVISILTALAFIATLLSQLVPQVMFLSFDAKDAVVLIAAFIFGPLCALLMTLAVSFIEMITISSTGIIGFVMNFLSTAAFACVASAIYNKKRDMKGVIISLVVGSLSSTGIMLLWNYLITPYYMNVPREAVVELILPLFLPFNLIKCGINSAIALILYKRISMILKKAHLLPEAEFKGSKKSTAVIVTIAGVIALISFILLFNVLRGSL